MGDGDDERLGDILMDGDLLRGGEGGYDRRVIGRRHQRGRSRVHFYIQAFCFAPILQSFIL